MKKHDKMAESPTPPRGQLSPGRGVQLHRIPLPSGELLRHVWIAVWDLDAPILQPVLEHPGGNVVIESDRAALYCVSQGISEQKLQGTGWAAAVLLRPAAITVITGRSMAPGSRSGPALPIGTPLPVPGDGDLVRDVRAVMNAEDHAPQDRYRAVADLYEEWGRQWSVDEEGILINRVVDLVEDDDGPRRVSDLAAEVALSTRALQRVTVHRTGLSPKWLIQRRRLQDAALALRRGDTTIADVAAELGYSDQAHLAREFKAVIGLTPSDYLRDSVSGGR
ncbi:AraC family transcriptional regulator [Nocardia sp. 348MFTsu5.1]|uniref:helix-turn-helix domain-containing protein n=1 Tax=Nocardia sp. 348MFTsu5.1 TaxID=1172185 RepID=UPI0003671417|nr:AraC family transcriptional regulator [Nocardia sp. 348MFTsu5.1]